MRSPIPLIGAAVLGVLVTGCIPPIASARLRIYPVQGPLAAPDRFQVLSVHATGFLSGTLDMDMPDGETFRGSWEPVLSKERRKGGSGVESPGKGLSEEWDLVYGKGYYVANVLGSMNHMSGFLYGTQGSTMALEMNSVASTVQSGDYSPLLGVARDNHGNIFKVIY